MLWMFPVSLDKQFQVSSVIGSAFILDTPLAIPDLVKKAAAIVHDSDNLHRMNALDGLHTVAFSHGDDPNVIDQGIWEDQWWNHLELATFPADSVCPFLLLCQLGAH